jgi:3-hydroxypropanoate dehydrogenase
MAVSSHPAFAVDANVLALLLTEARAHNGWQVRPVPDALLREIYEIAKWGSTSSNCQPMKLVFVRTTEGKKRLEPALSSTNRAKTMAAPVTAIIAYSLDFAADMDKYYHVKGSGSWYTTTPQLIEETGLRNSSIQGAYFLIAARALGLDVGAMSGFSNAKVDAAFFPDGRTKSNFLVNIGYGDAAALYPRMPRRPFDEACSFA